MIRIALSWVLVLAFSLCLFGQETRQTGHWQWTPPADHHAAVVSVTTDQGFGGTGCHFGDGWILTAHHVIADEHQWRRTFPGMVKFPNGHQYRYDVHFIHRDMHVDIAVLRAKCENEAWVRIAQVPPAHGEAIELVGLGGPGSPTGQKVRHFSMRVLTETDHTSLITSGVVTYGDSGAPAFNAKGEIVGVQSGGRNKIDQISTSREANWDALTPAVLTNVGPIRKLLGWGYQPQAICENGNCDSQSYGGQRQQGNIADWYPPAPQQGQSQQQRPQENPQASAPRGDASPPAAACACDPTAIESLRCDLDELKVAVDSLSSGRITKDQLADALAKVIAANPERFRGPVGPTGPTGAAGKDATFDVEQVATLVEKRLPPFHVQVVDEARNPLGPPSTVSLGGTLHIQHRIIPPSSDRDANVRLDVSAN